MVNQLIKECNLNVGYIENIKKSLTTVSVLLGLFAGRPRDARPAGRDAGPRTEGYSASELK